MAIEDYLQNLFPSAPSYLPGLLGAEQAQLAQQQAQQQGLLGLGLGLMQASGPSTQRMGLGQMLAQGIGAGQQAYQGVYQQKMQEALMGQQIADIQKKRAQQEAMQRLFPQVFQQTTERGAVAGEEGPVPTAQQRIAIDPQKLSMLAMASGDPLAALANIAKTVPELRKAGLVAGGASEVDPFAPFLSIENPNLQAVAAQYSRAFKSGSLDDTAINRAVESLGKMAEASGATTADIRGYNLAVQQAQERGHKVPTFLEYKSQLAEAGRTVIDMTGGQKGFENEKALRQEFQGLPEYKAFQEMRSAYSAIADSLKQGTAIGDVAAATKLMKLLDPGSVVRESELGIAMAATGLADRVRNYANRIITGEKLTPAQKREFEKLASDLFGTAVNAFNEKRGYYEGLANTYGFSPVNIIGKAAELPPLVTTQQGGGDLQSAAAAELARRRGR